jgi:pyruvate-formate lyase-activating enzyme
MFARKINSCDGVYSDSLDVRFTRACDNACAFCIERAGIAGRGRTRVEAMIAATLAAGKGTILILGGEPFLFPDLLAEYVRGIAPTVRAIYLTTSIPPALDPANPAVAEVLAALTGLNVSVHHYDSAINDAVLAASASFDRLARLGELLADRTLAPRLRVCTNLVAGFLDSRAEIERHLSVMAALGTREIKLNELQQVGPEAFVSFEEVYGRRLPSPYAHGCQTDISEMFDYPNMRILLKRACFLVSPREQASAADLAKVIVARLRPARHTQLVLYEDGSLSEGWLSGSAEPGPAAGSVPV